MSIPEGFEPIARDGELILYADEKRENGLLLDTMDMTQSPIEWLPVFYKWGHFRPIEKHEESEE